MKNRQRICSQTDSPENSRRTEMTQMVGCETFQNHFKAASVGSLVLLNMDTIQEEARASIHRVVKGSGFGHHQQPSTSTHTSVGRTLLDVGDPAFGLLVPGFFFLILIPGTGAELRASRKPVDSIAAARQSHSWKYSICFCLNVC